MPQDPSLSETGDCKIAIVLLNPSPYYYTEIYLKMESVVDLAYPLRDIEE